MGIHIHRSSIVRRGSSQIYFPAGIRANNTNLTPKCGLGFGYPQRSSDLPQCLSCPVSSIIYTTSIHQPRSVLIPSDFLCGKLNQIFEQAALYFDGFHILSVAPLKLDETNCWVILTYKLFGPKWCFFTRLQPRHVYACE